ncbi:FAD-binding monooxygenase [Sphingomonas sp. Leaf412]|uniref:NAD(P)/FAD-dependent oxidoreductase n=1 Tax=Sphingomonas sp. Leaf412 TaxID=1736370 RepID=UPI0006F646EA|nr:FAD-dependent monooxygenase [Sphingomonas sp. Leaf412]KQT35058.1 FAD-binding monooxygenase [Sphingomonas sp. Leaf412]
MRDPLILGGGPAGTAAAIILARGGRRPTLLERTRETGDPLCGGFLSWRTLDALARLGIARDALNPRAVTRLRVIAGDRVREVMLPRPALAVSRHRLDTLMLAAATTTGARVERGVTARAVEDGRVRTGDGAVLTPDIMLLATGKHDLRGLARPAARDGDPALGIRIRLGPSPALEALVGDAIELHLFDRGYAGVVMQEDGSANLCMAVRRSRLDGGDPATLLDHLAHDHPALGARLQWRHASSDAVANVPYGWRALSTVPGIYRLGDQAAVIPSLAGEGVGIAVASGMSAAHAILEDVDAPTWQRGFARDARRPLAIAGAIRALAERPAIARPLMPLMPAAFVRLIADATRIDAA